MSINLLLHDYCDFLIRTVYGFILEMFHDPVPVLDPGKKGGSGSGRIREKNYNRNRIINKTYIDIIFAISQKSSNIWNNFSVNTVQMNLINLNGIHVSSPKKLCYFEFLNINLKQIF